MTTAPSFERSLEQWLLAEAPTHAPGEILANALERVAEGGQDRYLTQRVFGDRVGSSRTLRFVGLTAVTALLAVALVFSAAIIGGRPTLPVPPPPVATPTPATTPSASPTDTPADSSDAGAFVPGPELLVGRGYHTTTQLLDGRVLVVGGQIHPDAMVPLVDSAEIWNPNASQDSGFVRTDPPVEGRSMHTATLLPDGRVLVLGGWWYDELVEERLVSSAEVWDPRTETFSPAGEMVEARYSHSATLLPDGTVLIAGGSTPSEELTTIEIWDSTSSSFSSAGRLAEISGENFALPLFDGRVMFVGREDTEFWDPITGETTTGPELVEPRYFHSATLLGDGRVLVTGGLWGTNEDIVVRTSAEVWDPSTNLFRLVDPPDAPRSGHTSTLLDDGRVLIISGGEEASTFEIWDPATEAFAATGSTIENRDGGGETATLLDDGRVLIVGSMSRFGITRSTEFWDAAAEPLPPRPPTPAPDFTPTPPPVHVGG